ncbi:conserved hypothetical protein [Leishmania infantum JPCM5]|uniref:Uncharacterized protein n=3 Tax=Leishmania donovani species complex TaxID=38574 RepID=A4IDU4_LEIIN|nr:conserved hypothetical protein [Leishmania infantum JPCM5]CAC9552369.1 hypothetical_protein_-_conserved [Leishmania infantum]CAM73029.1 conserved hypothetical protein [Leishmania infantum JPCM5]SUZ46926.1 hypothetical_protein_-_conserved [Leishmania infantum]|eukprot:XP_001469913.1 conserved hypothetical protein [Leishmania infantum JPCM5]
MWTTFVQQSHTAAPAFHCSTCTCLLSARLVHMRQRRFSARVSGAASSAAVARDSAVKSHSRYWRRWRGFGIASGCFVLCVVLYVCLGNSIMFQSSGQQLQRRRPGKYPVLAERDVVALEVATSQVANLATLPTLNDLVKSAAELGAVYAQVLEQVVAAQEVEDGGRVLRELGVSQNHLSSGCSSLRRAADVCYAKLKAMLLQEAHAELHMAPTSLVCTTYGWMLGNIYLYSAVLPEYYLLRDDSTSHALVLLRSINVLSWSPRVHTVPSSEMREHRAAVATYDLFNWSGGAACRRGLLSHVPHAKRFCESSFSSWSAVARRVAATYEELIVLHPTYAPLRLHYAISFAFLAMDTAADVAAGGTQALEGHPAKALKVIRSDRSKLERTYRHADAAHGPVLALLEAFLTPVALRTADQDAQLVAALREWGSCAEAQAALLEATSWPGGVFPGEYRAPLLRDAQLLHLLAKAQLHLGDDHAALQTLRLCL